MAMRLVLAALLGLTALVPALGPSTGGSEAASPTPTYVVTDLGELVNTTVSLSPTGEVVGTSSSPTRGALWTPTVPNGPSGTWRALDPLEGATQSFATGINASGQVVGVSCCVPGGRAVL